MFINRSPLPLEIYHCMTEYQIRAEDENQCCITEQQLSNPNTFKSWLAFPPILPLINYLNGFQYFEGLVFGSLKGCPGFTKKKLSFFVPNSMITPVLIVC